MFILPALLIIVALALYPAAFKRYQDSMEEWRKENIRLRQFLPIGLLMADSFKKGYSTYYDRKLLAATGEIYGIQQALPRLKLHWAEKFVLLILAAIFCAFIAAITRPDWSFVLFFILLSGCAAYLPDRELFGKVAKRRKAIQRDFPDFINKLVLLINAGMTVQKAWERAAVGTGKDAPLYSELSIALQDIKAGKPEHRAYEEFAKRCRTPEITRFVSVVLQNFRKGNAELVPILRMFSVECWEMRKNTAKRYGEEASTRMLFPMMLIFAAVLLIVGVPAVLSLQGIG